MKWSDYVMKSGPWHDRFWSDHLRAKRDILYVVASGFDPRMCDGAESIAGKGGDGRRDCRLLRFFGTGDLTAMSYGKLVEDNTKRLERLFSKWKIRVVDLAPPSGRGIELQRNATCVVKDEDYAAYTDIVVDISSMPTQVFFPLLGAIMRQLSGDGPAVGRAPNLFILVSEDTAVDRAISKIGLNEEAGFVHGFTGDMALQAKESGPSIWIPVLGENRTRELERIHQKIDPAETCPVVPSPSDDPRRGDLLLLEYRDVLGRIGIDPRNMIYASEQNPFDVYRQIYDAIVHYDRVLKPLGIYRFAISPMSSKLMSVGAFLAAYELTYERDIGPGIALVGAAGYRFEATTGPRTPNLFTVWVSGECYEP